MLRTRKGGEGGEKEGRRKKRRELDRLNKCKCQIPTSPRVVTKLLGFAYCLDDWICCNHSGYFPLEH